NLTVVNSADVGDTLGTARATGLGTAGGSFSDTSRLGTMGGTRDVDLYRLDALLGSVLTAETLDPATNARLTNEAVLRLFNADRPPLGERASGSLPYTLPATGVYYVGVSVPANVAYSPLAIDNSGWSSLTADYRLNLTVTLAPDVGDTLATAVA